MTFEINKTEYIAVIAGMDCLPRTNEDEIIDSYPLAELKCSYNDI